LRHLITNVPAMMGRDGNALYQMRVALRRLRAAVSLFSAVVDDDRTCAVKTELRWLAPIDNPLWEQQGLKEDETAGQGFLPDAPTCEREALITAPITTEPVQILRVPGPGWTAFVASLATALALAAATLKFTTVGLAFGLVAAAAFLYWLWSMDPALPRARADAGRGVALPLYTNGSGSVGWWGMVVLLIADAAVMASFIFAYLFLWTARPAVWPPDGSQLPGLVEPSLIAAVIVAAYVLFEAADRLNQCDRRLAAALCLVASAALAVGSLALG
jgi:cytochrome c oxidase subunit I+III